MEDAQAFGGTEERGPRCLLAPALAHQPPRRYICSLDIETTFPSGRRRDIELKAPFPAMSTHETRGRHRKSSLAIQEPE